MTTAKKKEASAANGGPTANTNKRAQATSNGARLQAGALTPRALEDLRKSGISAKDAARAGIAGMPSSFGARTDSYVIPYFEPDCKTHMLYTDAKSGERREFCRIKLFDAVDRKYDQPKDSANRLYFPPVLAWRTICKDPTVPLLLVEGEKKALCASLRDFPAVGLGGVWNWLTRQSEDEDAEGDEDKKRQPSRPIADLDKVVWKERKVYIAFDSDKNEKPDVLLAEERLAVELQQRGAKVYLVDLPADTKGLDDYAVKYGPRALAQLVREARPAPRSIVLIPGQLPAMVDAATAALVFATKAPTFARGGGLVRVISVAEARAQGLHLPGDSAGKGERERDPAQPVITAVHPDWLRVHLGRSATFYKYDGRTLQLRPVDCPSDLARSVVAMGEWKDMPVLRSVVTAPFLRADGTICAEDGYDPASGVLLRPSIKLAPTLDKPTKRDAAQALARLCGPFDQVSWLPNQTALYRGTWVSLVLTLATRHILPLVPAYLLDAPRAGTGKTLLIDCASLIVYGVEPAKRSYPHEENEMRKVLHSALLAGDPVILFDNADTGTSIGGEALNKFITARTSGDRTLGKSETPRLPNAAVVAVTGNNISARQDFVRRAMVVRLDANMEQPEQRRFRIEDLEAHVIEHRPELLAAVLTILRAYALAGQPKPPGRAPLGSFVAWYRLVCGAITWLGLPNPVLTQDSLREEDVDHSDTAALFDALHQRFGTEPFKTHVVINSVSKIPIDPEDRALHAAINSACGGTKHFGYWLRNHKNRVVGKLKLLRTTADTTGNATWRLWPAKSSRRGF